jgi:hypothetical protein
MIAAKDSQGAITGDSQRALLLTLQTIEQSKSAIWLDKRGEEDWVEAQEATYSTLEERQAKNQRRKAKKLEKKRR